MNVLNRLIQIIHWYTKDGVGRCIGKVVGSLLTAVSLIDFVFGTRLLGAAIIFLVVFSYAAGPLLVKWFDFVGLLDLSPEQETLRKGFGLITGIEDWFELLIGFLQD